MNPKPYRILNPIELSTLQQGFDNTLALWNKQYARFALSCQIEYPPKTQEASGVLITEQNQTLAFMPEQELSLIKQALFGERSSCFDASAQSLFNTLIQSLLNSKVELKNATDLNLEAWFYKGSPVIALNFFIADETMTIVLHPQWVLQKIPKSKLNQPALDNLDDALQDQLLHCQVELNPMSLPLHALIHLKPGDVIQTDHPIALPARLQHHQQTLCQVEIGRHNSFKSIQIKSSS